MLAQQLVGGLGCLSSRGAGMRPGANIELHGFVTCLLVPDALNAAGSTSAQTAVHQTCSSCGLGKRVQDTICFLGTTSACYQALWAITMVRGRWRSSRRMKVDLLRMRPSWPLCT